MIQRHPVSAFFLVFRVARGLFYRKLGYYTQLTSKNYITHFKINKIVLLSKNPSEPNNFWRKQLHIDSNREKLWGRHRYIFLEKFFLKILDTDYIDVFAKDREDVWSTCQLNWLFFSVRTNEKTPAEANDIIDSCCKFLRKNREKWVFRTFTLSELISNIIKIKLYFGRNIELSNETKEFVSLAVLQIAGSFEVYSVSHKTSLNHTNNHVLANVRSLYWATKIYSNKEIRKLADYAFETWCIPLFSGGDLDEGSTTYHLVAAQCIFDISFFKDVATLPRVDKLLQRLREHGFLSKNTFPVIGDISPDPSLPCAVNDAERVSDLISAHFKKYNTGRSEIVTDNEKSDFEFFNQGDWSFILHNRDPKKHIQHSHNDYGSPILKYKNEIVIFDLGRTSYNNQSEWWAHQTSTRFHSVPQIDGLEQCPRRYRDLYLDHYLNPIASDVDSIEHGMTSLKDREFLPVCQKKFILFPNNLYGGFWIRVFSVNRLDPKEFIIEDLIELSVCKPVVFRKYIPQRVMNDCSVSFKFYMNNKLTDPNIEESPNSEYYGHVSIANSLVLESLPSKSHRLFTKVRIENEPSNFHR